MVDFDALPCVLDGRGRWLARSLRGGAAVYAIRNRHGKRPKTEHMHRVVALDKRLYDHINRNGLDNRRRNLRPASVSQNNANTQRRDRGEYRGVYARGSKYRAGIRANGHMIWLGTYASRDEAAREYDSAAGAVFGEFAHLNFPE